jgi:hypothetical protein
MSDPVAYSDILTEAGRVLASPFWLLLILSVVAWRYNRAADPSDDFDGDPAE